MILHAWWSLAKGVFKVWSSVHSRSLLADSVNNAQLSWYSPIAAYAEWRKVLKGRFSNCSIAACDV